MRPSTCFRCGQAIDGQGDGSATVILITGPDSEWGFTYRSPSVCGDCRDLLMNWLEIPPRRPKPPPEPPLPERPFGCHDERLELS